MKHSCQYLWQIIKFISLGTRLRHGGILLALPRLLCCKYYWLRGRLMSVVLVAVGRLAGGIISKSGRL